MQQSFMIQYCCGTGDCNTATPAASIDDAHSQAAIGTTTTVSLAFKGLGASGRRSVDGIGKVSWKRLNHTRALDSESVHNKLQRRDCTFHPTSDRMTTAGQQVRASANQGIIGYMSYIPTLNCWDSTFSDCNYRDGDEIYAIVPFQATNLPLKQLGQSSKRNVTTKPRAKKRRAVPEKQAAASQVVMSDCPSPIASVIKITKIRNEAMGMESDWKSASSFYNVSTNTLTHGYNQEDCLHRLLICRAYSRTVGQGKEAVESRHSICSYSVKLS
nr:hypothetical protein CFP56_33400 [Quercus suber]